MEDRPRNKSSQGRYGLVTEFKFHGRLGILVYPVEGGGDPMQYKTRPCESLAVGLQWWEADGVTQNAGVTHPVDIEAQPTIEIMGMAPPQGVMSAILRAVVVANPEQTNRAGELEVESSLQARAGDNIHRIADLRARIIELVCGARHTNFTSTESGTRSLPPPPVRPLPATSP